MGVWYTKEFVPEYTQGKLGSVIVQEVMMERRRVIIIICVLVVLGAVAAGLILFLPRNETIHIENPFVKTHIADAEVQGDMPEGTKLDTVIDITVTVNNAGLCCASGTIKLGEQTFEINDIAASADGYTLSRKR